MTVRRSLRYQILRRDNHACRYCGATAPDVKLTVDHVVPEALGGSDDPTNLVTACETCNGGKSATPPDAAIVADVERDALRWARAIETAAFVRRVLIDARDRYVDHFAQAWNDWTYGPEGDKKPIPADPGWRESIERFYELGLERPDLERAVRKAMTNTRVAPGETWRYFCGICWSIIRELHDSAAEIMASHADEPDWNA
jgi:hypothetical protein